MRQKAARSISFYDAYEAAVSLFEERMRSLPFNNGPIRIYIAVYRLNVLYTI